ncbi:MAG: secretin N-terminal domain-containing protein [Acidobacteriota bacterium]
MSSPQTESADCRLRRRSAAWVLVAAALSAAAQTGCASLGPLKAGTSAERQQDWDRAVIEYTKAVRQDPGDRLARLSLERAKLRASQDHFTRGRRLASMGKLEEALVELQLAQQFAPASTEIDDAVREAKHLLRARVPVVREGKTQLQTLIERTRDLPPAGAELPGDLRLPDTLMFREASARDVFLALARFAGANLIFDPGYRDAQVTIDLRNTSLEQALASLTAATRNFFRVSASKTVTIIPDTPAKRREYEEEVVRTFYLSNADVKETIDLLRIVVDARRLAPVTGTNAITIKDTPERVAAAGRIVAAIDKARPEVIIDVEVLEVDRTLLREFGLQIASPGQPSASPGISGAAGVDRETLTLRDLHTLTTGDVFLTGFPALFYRLLKSDASSRSLANPQLRTSEGIAAQARFGERVPVPNTTFAPIATGGVNQQPITSFNYENIGVNIDITPRTHHNDDVSLTLKVEVSSISGTGYGGLPTFGNRSVNTVIRLRDGETSVLAGLIRDDERTVLEGVPGLSDIPLIGRLFARNKVERQETDIILTLTPHIIRVLDLEESDLRPFRVGGDVGGAIELPSLDPKGDQPGVTLPKPIIKPPGRSVTRPE